MIITAIVSTIITAIVTALFTYIITHKQYKHSIKPELVRKDFFIRGDPKLNSSDILFQKFFLIIPIHNIGKGIAKLMSIKIEDINGTIEEHERIIRDNGYTFAFYHIPAGIPKKDFNFTLTYFDDDNAQKTDYTFTITHTELEDKRDEYVLKYNEGFWNLPYGGFLYSLKDTFYSMVNRKVVLYLKSLH